MVEYFLQTSGSTTITDNNWVGLGTHWIPEGYRPTTHISTISDNGRAALKFCPDGNILYCGIRGSENGYRLINMIYYSKS